MKSLSLQRLVFILLASFGNFLFGQEKPWLTGPLVAPIGEVVPYGHWMVKSYTYVSVQRGAYDKNGDFVFRYNDLYSLKAKFFCYFGLTPWCDLNIIPEFSFNTTLKQHAFYPNDLTVGLDFQLMQADLTPYFPGIKLAIREVFPTGKFQLLSPRKERADLTGKGSFATQFDLVLYKLFHLGSLHWLSTTLSTQYTLHSPVEVHGFNAYGGGFGTRGTVTPGNQFESILSFEFTCTRNWALSLDTVFTQTNRSSFFGLPGISLYRTLAKKGQPSSEQLSFAPAVEYNWNQNLGLIAGAWISVYGRNSPQFYSGVLNVQYSY